MTGNIFIKESIIPILIGACDTLKKYKIALIVKSTDDEVEGKLSIYRTINYKKKYTAMERAKLMNETIGINTVGMLSRFKITRSKDVFGRFGEGKPMTCRVAIFLGILNDRGVLKARFRTFNGSYFATKEPLYVRE